MTRTRFLAALSAAWLFTLLAGCGGSTAPVAEATPAATPAAPPTPAAPAPSDAPADPPPSAAIAPIDLPWAGQSPDEPFNVREYLANRAEPADNAAPLYRPALATWDIDAGDEEAKALGTEINALSNLGPLINPAAQQARIAAVLEKTASAIQQIDAAQAKPQCVFTTELRYSANLAHPRPAMTLAKLCIIQLAAAKQKGDFDQAEAALRRGLRMSRDLVSRGGAATQLVSIFIDGQLLSAVEVLIAPDPKLTPEQCDHFAKALHDHEQNMPNRVDEAVHMEYILARNTIDDLQSGRQTIAEFFESIAPGMASKVQLPQFDPKSFSAAVPKFDRAFKRALAETSGPYKPAENNMGDIQRMAAEAQAAAKSGKGLDTQMAGLGHMIIAPLSGVRDADYRARAHVAGVEMLLALKRYQIAHQSLPKELSEAAKESALQTIPMDPYSGEPLKYVVADGKPTIYSIGKDLQDDGGLVDWKSSTQPGDFLFVLRDRPALPAAAEAAAVATANQKRPAKGTAKPKTTNKTPIAAASSAPDSAPANAANEPETRTWTSTAGTTIEAQLVKLDVTVAVLKKTDGTEIRVPLAKLSKFDQQWIKNNTP